jgi:hypothetical protein
MVTHRRDWIKGEGVRFMYDKVPPGRLSVYNGKVDRSSVTEFIFLEKEGFYG